MHMNEIAEKIAAKTDMALADVNKVLDEFETMIKEKAGDASENLNTLKDKIGNMLHEKKQKEKNEYANEHPFKDGDTDV